MNKYKVSFLLSVLFFMACSGKSLNSKDFNIVKLHADSIKIRIMGKDKNFIQNDIAGTMIGETGYYFIIGNDGIILNHPVRNLVGRNFNSYVKFNVNKLKNHDYRFLIHGDSKGEHLLYATRLDESRIICITAFLKSSFGEYEIF